MMSLQTLAEITRMATALQTAAPPPAVKEWLAVAALRGAGETLAAGTHTTAIGREAAAAACLAAADLLEGTKR